MLRRRPEPLKLFDYLGPYPYFLTFCTDWKHKAFVDAACIDIVSTQILLPQSANGSRSLRTATCQTICTCS